MSNFTDALTGFGLGTASSLVQGGINQLFAKKNMKQQLKNQKALYEFTNDVNQQTLQENALNQPTLQKQGLVNAGLNPATLNGSFSAPVTGSGSAGSFAGAPSVDAPDVGSWLQTKADLKIKAANEDLIAAQAENVREDTKLKAEERTGKEQENTSRANFMEQYGGLTSEDAQAISNIAYTQSQTRSNDINNMSLAARNQAVLSEISSRIHLSKAEEKKVYNDLDLANKRLPAELTTLYAQAYQARQAGNLSKGQLEKVREETKQVAIQNDYLEKQLKAQLRLTDAQINNLQQQLTESAARIAQLKAQGRLIEADAELRKTQNQLEKKYGGAQRVMGMINETLNTGIRAFSAYTTAGVSEAMGNFYNSKSAPSAPAPAPVPNFNPWQP